MSADRRVPADPGPEDLQPSGGWVPADLPPLDLPAVGRRLRQRARRRAADRAGALAVAVALAVVVVPSLPGGGERVQLAAGPPSPTTQAQATRSPAPSPSPQALPLALPPGYVRCAGPTAVGAVTRTTFCAGPDRSADLVLEQGPHWALPEIGTPVAVAQRTGYLHRTAEGTTLTVSDETSDDDTHHALTVADPDHPADPLRAAMASIPAIAVVTPAAD